MRVFISYPTEVRALAERLAATLRAERHEVFFDAHDIVPGDAFDLRIRTELERTDLVVFFITPESVAEGSYARAELSVAQSRWPSLAGRLLPVMVAETPLDAIPSTIRQLSITRPAGEPVAEIAAAVGGVATRRRARRMPWLYGTATVLAIAAIGVLAFGDRPPAQPRTGLAAITAFEPPTIPADVRARARAVAQIDDAFYLALTAPNELVRLDGQLKPTGSGLALAGTPTAITANSFAIVVGTRSPGTVEVVQPAEWRSLVRREVPEGMVNGSAASTTVVSVVLTASHAWVTTGGDDGSADIRRLNVFSGVWEPLPYSGDVTEFDARGVRLRVAGDSVWGVTTATTPSTLFKLSERRVVEYGGHSNGAIACARDVMPLLSGSVAAPGCSTGVFVLRRTGAVLGVAQTIEAAIVSEKGDWEAQWLTPRVAGHADSGFVAAVTVERKTADGTFLPARTQVTAFTAAGIASTALDARGVGMVSLAAGRRCIVAVVRDTAGRHDVVALPATC